MSAVSLKEAHMVAVRLAITGSAAVGRVGLHMNGKEACSTAGRTPLSRSGGCPETRGVAAAGEVQGGRREYGRILSELQPAAVLSFSVLLSQSWSLPRATTRVSVEYQTPVRFVNRGMPLKHLPRLPTASSRRGGNR